MAKTYIHCAKCGKPVEADISDQPKILNFEHFSQIILEHSGEALCVCGAVVVPGVQGVQGMQLLAVPVPPTQQKRLVQPVTSLKV